jgi:hypothetical protein
MRMRRIFISARIVGFTVLSFGTLIQSSYASLEPLQRYQYLEGGPKVWAGVALPLNWRERARTARPSTLIGVKDNGQAVLMVINSTAEHSFLNLKTLSLEAAEALWGKARIGSHRIKIFDFQKPLSESVDYQLDTKFRREKLSAYRIRGADFQNPRWVKLSNIKYTQALPVADPMR